MDLPRYSDESLLKVLLGSAPKESDASSSSERLTDRELVDLLAGRSNRLHDAPSLGLREVLHYPIEALQYSGGFTPVQACRLARVGEALRRLLQGDRDTIPRLLAPEDVVKVLGPIVALSEVEQFYCLSLDCRSGLIGVPLVISRGDVDGTEAGPRNFYRPAVRCGATGAIAVHNHPTGNPEPSPADRAVTRRLVDAGRLMDIPLADHVIIGSRGFTSLRRDAPELWRGSTAP